jgi:hypothetical protein
MQDFFKIFLCERGRMMNVAKIIRRINCIWRMYNMRQQAVGFMKGIGAGIVAGAAIAAVGSRMAKNDHGFKHRANKRLRSVGELFDDVQELFR